MVACRSLDRHAVLGGLEAEVIGRAIDHVAIDAPAGHQDGEAVWIVIAPVAALGDCVRPNSPPPMTSVSSSRPRRFRSRINAAVALSILGHRSRRFFSIFS